VSAEVVHLDALRQQGLQRAADEYRLDFVVSCASVNTSECVIVVEKNGDVHVWGRRPRSTERWGWLCAKVKEGWALLVKSDG
jgi:hypothetical protein